ncbi:MAG TPA: 50S ribosomal protein L25 [Candidatus Eisenbacteria bacterium]|nr:50S ribosomal protein L25 [Candidatus Eisenbacteria bacterium]
MAVIPLTAGRRSALGKGGARKARAAGNIPAVLYGHGETPVPLAISTRAFEDALRRHKGGNAIVNLGIDGGEFTALIRDVQYDPLTHHVIHLDFQHISLTEQVEVEVTLHLTGLAVGVKDGGGILEHILRTVEVRCLPTAIPPAIEADVSALNIGDSLHVRDLHVPDVVILTDADAAIATVVPPTVIEEKPAEEVAAAPAATEPELAVAKGKKEEEAGAEKEKDKEKK